ncbi:MAG: TetR/AcrR family transcriptional regulator [Betaproteobacteria bacterium]|nr:TetR/AcrR family transcriptional regulator [Betaproteobacteria bacterium]MDH5219707.1 TetR/AcrR family transcriptional regulator [Betaproteobacteria bacterium]MDH5350726.1 TetR/AcrR family transcriptional regulator [Betaproteobacteria bacterium]
MIIKARAVSAEDKLERRNEILDAAQRLFHENPEGFGSMDALAEAARVGKGTLYLYFRSKEEVLVALHERNAGEFFATLLERVERDPAFDLDAMIALVTDRLLASPVFPRVGSLVCGNLERMPEGAVRDFKATIAAGHEQIGPKLDGALGLADGEGARLMQYSYALMLGLWHLTCSHTATAELGGGGVLLSDYATEVRHALRQLWVGAKQIAPRNASPQEKTR